MAFVRFHTFGLQLMVLLGLLGMPILLPCNLGGTQVLDHHTHLQPSWDIRWTMAHISQRSGILWVHAVCCWSFRYRNVHGSIRFDSSVLLGFPSSAAAHSISCAESRRWSQPRRGGSRDGQRHPLHFTLRCVMCVGPVFSCLCVALLMYHTQVILKLRLKLLASAWHDIAGYTVLVQVGRACLCFWCCARVGGFWSCERDCTRALEDTRTQRFTQR